MKFFAMLLSSFMLLCVSAKAATIYNFNVTGGTISSSGTITVTQVGTAFEITAITGTYSDSIAGNAFSGTITGLVAGSYSATSYSTNYAGGGSVYYDNLFYPSGSAPGCSSTNVSATDKLDYCGLLFNVSANSSTYYVNLFGAPGTTAGYDVIDFKSGAFLSNNVPVTTTFTTAVATPEPSTWLLTATGLFGVAAAFSRRRILQ